MRLPGRQTRVSLDQRRTPSRSPLPIQRLRQPLTCHHHQHHLLFAEYIHPISPLVVWTRQWSRKISPLISFVFGIIIIFATVVPNAHPPQKRCTHLLFILLHLTLQAFSTSPVLLAVIHVGSHDMHRLRHSPTSLHQNPRRASALRTRCQAFEPRHSDIHCLSAIAPTRFTPA